MQLTTPADLLALIPSLMNREPQEILVLLTIKYGQIQAALGMELPEDEDGMAEYVAAIVAQMVELKPEALAMVVYTEAESNCDHEPYEHLNLLIMLALDVLTPMVVNPGVLVKGGRYHVYGSTHWHDIEEVKESTLAATMVLNGIPLEPKGLVIPEPTAATEDVAAAIDTKLGNLPPYRLHIEQTWLLPYVSEERALYESLLQRGFGATEAEAVDLIACFQNPLLRDRLLVDTVSNTLDPVEFGDVITGQSEAVPDPERVEAAIHLMDNLMQWTADRHRPPLLLAQAWLHWMQGRTLDAESYLDMAVEVDPDYTMAKAFRRYIRELKRLPDCVTHGRDE